MKTVRRSMWSCFAAVALLASTACAACGGRVDDMTGDGTPEATQSSAPAPATNAEPATNETNSDTSNNTRGAFHGGANAEPTPIPNTIVIDPEWQRSNEYFLAPSAPNPDLEYYSANTYSLFNEDNTQAGSAFTWTTSETWNGPSTTDMPVDGPGTIPGFVATDTWFLTYDRVGDGVTGTTYWFRANVDLGPKSSWASITLADKYHPDRLAVNDGMIVFLNGVAQPIMPNVSSQGDPQYGAGLTRDDTETGWSFDGLTLSPDALHDGTNEIAVMFDERFGDGGLGHLQLTVVTQS